MPDDLKPPAGAPEGVVEPSQGGGAAPRPDRPDSQTRPPERHDRWDRGDRDRGRGYAGGSRHAGADRWGDRRRTHDRRICRPLEVIVGDMPLEKAVRAFRNKVAREGILKELKRRRFYEKPSAVRKRKMREAERRRRRTRRRLEKKKANDKPRQG